MTVIQMFDWCKVFTFYVRQSRWIRDCDGTKYRLPYIA